jgi:putative membrane protein
MNSGPETTWGQHVKPFAQRWLITTLAVLVAANVVPGIRYDTVAGLFVASLLLGILNAFVRPIMLLLSLPLLVFSLGLSFLFINALLLYLVGQLVRTFHVGGFWSAFWGGLVISIVSTLVSLLTGTGSGRIQVRRGRPGSQAPRAPKPPGGPVIDV